MIVVGPTHAIEHQFSVIGKLDAEPIPSDEVFAKIGRTTHDPSNWFVTLNGSLPSLIVPEVASLVNEWWADGPTLPLFG